MRLPAALLFLCLITQTTVGNAAEREWNASDVVQAIADALDDTAKTFKDAGLELAQAEVTFRTTASTELGGGFDLLFFEAEAGASTEAGRTITLVLRPDATKGRSVSGQTEQLSDLVRTLVDSSQQVIAMTCSTLTLAQATGELEFVIVNELGGGLSFDFPPFSVDLGASGARAVSNRIRLTFRKLSG